MRITKIHILKHLDTDMKWVNTAGEMAPIDLLNAGFSFVKNAVSMKNSKAKCNAMKYACIKECL